MASVNSWLGPWAWLWLVCKRNRYGSSAQEQLMEAAPIDRTKMPLISEMLSFGSIDTGGSGSFDRYGTPVSSDWEQDGWMDQLLHRAQRSRADLLLLYSIASFDDANDPLAAVNLFTLGSLPTNIAEAEATAYWVLVEPGSGTVLGRGSVNDKEAQLANWHTADPARRQAHDRAVAAAVSKLLPEVHETLVVLSKRPLAVTRLDQSSPRRSDNPWPQIYQTQQPHGERCETGVR